MSEDDRRHWDERWQRSGMAPIGFRGPPPEFEAFESLIPTSGLALEVACGRGRGAVWLADRGLEYLGVDISPVAVDLARRLTERLGLSDNCSFKVHDLKDGLPTGPQVDVLFCYKYRQRNLDRPMINRLKRRGILLIATLSEVGAGPGSHRVRSGELPDAFAALSIKAHGEGAGMAWLIGEKM